MTAKRVWTTPTAGTARRWTSSTVALLVAGGAAAVPVTSLQTATPTPGGTTTYGVPEVVCTVRAPVLAQLSGLASRGGLLYAVTDQDSSVRTLGEDCSVTATAALPDAVDVEDIAATADGLLWIGDIGGNRSPREEVAVFRFNPASGNVARLAMGYPDGPHDAEALLVTPSGQVVVVTKEDSGTSGVYVAPSPLDPEAVNELQLAGRLDLRSFEGRTRGDGSVQVTGGSVAPDGTHVVLRTYLDAFEWDAADGDVVGAMTGGSPRVIELPRTPQGEAVAYGPDGLSLFTGGEQLPSEVYEIAVVRPVSTTAAPESSALSSSLVPLVALGAAAAAALAVLVSLARSLRLRHRSGREAFPR